MPEKKEWWFMELIEEKLKTVASYHGVIVNVRLDEARLPDGSTAKREVVEHPGGVTVLPLEADGTVWCVRQYRYPFSRTLLELPAGKLEPGEAPERAAARELSEETGLSAGRLQYLGANFTSPRLLAGGAAHLPCARSAPRRGASRSRGVPESGAPPAGCARADGAGW